MTPRLQSPRVTPLSSEECIPGITGIWTARGSQPVSLQSTRLRATAFVGTKTVYQRQSQYLMDRWKLMRYCALITVLTMNYTYSYVLKADLLFHSLAPVSVEGPYLVRR
ncbi:hypothetical protein GGS20DRAFT_591000 [Poronia punctata]|nr:hypothetical protein GGS20DRAFT_591000 [Poronia punctata]